MNPDGRQSWLSAGLAATVPGESGWSSITSLAPEVFGSLEAIEDVLADLLPAELVQLCGARMAMLLGAPPSNASTASERLAELPRWPSSPQFDARERACLEVAEQFVMDVTGVDQHQIDALLAHFRAEQVLAFLAALWFEEAMLRLGLVLGVQRPRAVPTGAI